MKKALLITTGLCLAALSMVRLQLVAKEPDAVKEPVIETVELNNSDSDPKPAAPPASTEPAKPAAPSPEALQVEKKRVAEQLADLMSNRSRIISDLSRIKLQIMLAEARKKTPDEAGPPDAAVEYQLGLDPNILQATQRLNLYKDLLAEELRRGTRPDDPRMKALRTKIQKLEQNIEDRKATMRKQLLEQMAANPAPAPLPQLKKEKEYLKSSLAEIEESVQDLAKDLQNLEKNSAEVATQSERLAQQAKFAELAAGREEAGSVEVGKASAASASPAQKMVEQAYGAFVATCAAYQAETASLEAVYEWSLRWMAAAEIAASNDKQKVEAVSAHLKRMRDVQKMIEALYKIGTKGGEAKEMAAANFYVAEAERRLAQVAGQDVPGGVKDAEMQSLDLKIKIVELEGELKQTEVQLVGVAERSNRMKKLGNAVPEESLRQLQDEITKLKVHHETLGKQLNLYRSKLQLYARAGSPPVPVTKPVTAVPAKANTLVPPKRAPEPTATTAKRPLRYNNKDFDAWVEELRDDLSPERRREAIWALATFGANGYGPQAGVQIIEAMRGYSVSKIDGSPEASLAAAAVNAFGKIPSQDALPLVMKAFKSDNANERLFAVAVFPGIGTGPRGVRTLLEMLKDPDIQVRRRAMFVVAAIDPQRPELVPVLREALASEEQSVALSAIRIVGGGLAPVGLAKPRYLPIPALIPELVGLLNSADAGISGMTAQTLLQIGAEAIPELEKACLAENNKETPTKAEEVLKRIRERQPK